MARWITSGYLLSVVWLDGFDCTFHTATRGHYITILVAAISMVKDAMESIYTNSEYHTRGCPDSLSSRIAVYVERVHPLLVRLGELLLISQPQLRESLTSVHLGE